ncbi:Ig-like domain-containing protein [Cohnella abietis]|uniref:SLH domain-containing protein n=1 Tax=Cohnella abietis TaxID=2507935 RepID=A0A3T1DB72_9BACL|nr:Ig-like domain-containing protein [Cohnella abietis]BBI35352.1 hypothetical protein KCTCHS21_47510 [Cohnella abietis]
MRKTIISMLSLLLLISLPFTAAGASNLTTEQKFNVLKEKNIFTGLADGSSRLNESMSREQLAVVLYRLLELPAGGTTRSYDDVLKTRWSFKEIESVKRAELMGGTGGKIFSPALNMTVEQLAAVFVRSYGLTGGGQTPVTGKVSKWARGAVSLALDRKLIPQLSDYTVDATRGLLVDAAYAVYEESHLEPYRIRSVDVLSNQSLRVNLLQRADKTDKIRFSLKDTNGNNRNIQQAVLSQDGMSIQLWTDRQIAGVVHTLSVDGNTWNYISQQDDTTKPQIVSQPVRLPNKIIELTFSEPVESSSATNSSNYIFNNGLKLNTIQLSSDGKKVTFTTSEQVNDRKYQLTVRNVKDLAGNVMDTRSDLYFTGSNDTDKPKIAEVKINPNTAVISVKFNKKIDAQQAIQTNRYTIDKGLIVLQAKLENDGQTVTLLTSQQLDATVYTLTIAYISDLSGNVMDPSTHLFGGVANPDKQVKLQSIVAKDQNTLEVVFDRAITGNDLKNLKLTVLKDNGANINTNDWTPYVQQKEGSDRTFIFQYRARNNNQELFLPGHVYVAGVTGVAALVTINDADKLQFAGTENRNPNPIVTKVIVLGSKSVKVVFSEPVTGVNKAAFRIREKDAGSINIDSDELNDSNKVVTEVVLRLKDELQANKVYAMTFQPNYITDVPKWNGLQTTDGSGQYTVYFNGN